MRPSLSAPLLALVLSTSAQAVPHRYAEWIAQYNIPANVAGLTDDADFDGYQNLTEWAYGGVPNGFDADLGYQLVRATKPIALVHPLTREDPISLYGETYDLQLWGPWNFDAWDVRWRVEQSTDLQNWVTVPTLKRFDCSLSDPAVAAGARLCFAMKSLGAQRMSFRVQVVTVPSNFVIASVGDFGYDSPASPKPAKLVADMIATWSPHMIFTLGDNNYSEGAASTIDASIGQFYSRWIYPYLGSYTLPAGVTPAKEYLFFPVVGNHDMNTFMAKPFTDYFNLPGNERYYNFPWGPLEFVAINSDPYSSGHTGEPDGTTQNSVQGQWATQKLAASKAEYKIVYFHHPAYATVTGHGDEVPMQWNFKALGADLVLSGHNHNYERLEINGFPYIINGSGGRETKAAASYTPRAGSLYMDDFNYGAQRITYENKQVVFEFKPVNGDPSDIYVLDKYRTRTVVIPKGSNWKYYANSAAPSGSWKNLGYSDTTWGAGTAPMGYGDPVSTTLPYGSNANAKWTTTYFRKSVTLTGVSSLAVPGLVCTRSDDGAKVYLNGVEIFSFNLPANPSYSTFATTALGTTGVFDYREQAYRCARVPINRFVEGENSVAVEVHQSGANSSDLMFDLELAIWPEASSNLTAKPVMLLPRTQTAPVKRR